MPFDGNKISNILGTKLPQWLINQLETRANQGAQDSRDNDNILFLTNKTAWVRLVSSVDIINPSDIEYFRKVVGDTIKNKEDLAKQFVLFGGTSKYLRENSYQQRSGLGKEGSYGILGTDEIQKFGYRPMPGIQSVTIDTQGKLGSLRAATINFKCWDKSQLDIIDALYFKLGFTMFLEWGNTFFYPAGSSRIQSSELYSIDPFTQNLTKEEIAIQITKNTRESEGNYDALLGMVTNFNFSYNQDGGYDCTLKIMGLGILGDAIKINNPKDLPNILAEEIRKYNNTLSQIAAAAVSTAQPPTTPAPEQESLLKYLNLKINGKNKEPDAQDQLKIAQAAGLANSEAVSATNYDYLYDVENRRWSLLIPRLGVLIPSENVQNLVKTATIDTTKLFSQIDKNLRAIPTVTAVAGNVISQAINQTAVNASLEFKLYSQSRDVDTRSNIVTKKFQFSYSGVNGKKYPVGLFVQFDNTNNKFSGDNIDSQDVYTTVINEIKKNGDYTFDITNFKVGTIPGTYPEFGQIDNTFNSLTDPTTKISRFPIIRLYKKITVNVKDKIKIVTPGTTQNTVTESIGDVPVSVTVILDIGDTALIKDIAKGKDSPDYKRLQANIVGQNQKEFNKDEQQSQDQNASSVQIKQALELQSGLELTLRTIQVHALNNAIYDKKNIDIGRVVYKLDISNPKDLVSGIPFYKQIFSNGIFSDCITSLIDGTISDADPKNPQDRFRIQSKYGFATELMAGRVSIQELSKKQVDYKQLLSAYVVPYQVNQEIVKGVSTNHPVYIPLGLLLMILNHSCTIYDTKNASVQTPLVYVDFNPNLNFFLSNTKHLSTNPFKVLIPFEGGFSDYQALFSKNILSNDQKNILPLSGSSESTPLFDTSNNDLLSGQLPPVKFDNTNNNIYRGKLMNILLNIDYIIQLVREYSLKDGTNNIYLKTFLEQIISDTNKYLGNFNSLRVSYNDGGNTFQIVDDQVQPPLPGETILQPDNVSTIPLVGRFGIAKNLEIKTEVSSKLSSMIAISANADSANKATLSTNGDNFGFINTSYRDRFIPVKGDITGSLKSGQDSVKAAAIQFNQTISDFYSKINPSEANVSQATNYYIEKMSRIKNDEFPTRASTMIPVSVNFTTDGVSGFTMGQAFTVSQELLPYTYNNRIVAREKGLGPDYINKVGFAIVGLTNTIENNQWNTSVRANMIFLKNATDFTGSVKLTVPKNEQFGVNPTDETVSIPIVSTNFVGSNADAKKVAETYLGKSITDNEWSQLVSATYAEASTNQEERAWVMAVILNRTRTKFLNAQTITDTLTRKNQFQSVTGTSANSYQPSSNYIKGPNKAQADSIYGAVINFLLSVPKNYVYFTSNVTAAYGEGTSIAFLTKLKSLPGSKIIGQTVFATTA